MNIALIGATGFIGSVVLSELLSRGHQVTALARKPATVARRHGLTVVAADALDAAQVAHAAAGHDAVVSAYNPGWGEPQLYSLYLQGSQAIVDGVKASGVKHLLIVGCAGALYAAPGVQLVNTPEFPAVYRQGALGVCEFLNRVGLETELDWSVILPPLGLAFGPRTGEYRVGVDDLLPRQEGQPAGISVPDLAVAVVDEIEQPQHVRQPFTVANLPKQAGSQPRTP
jgi:uncharacterized protein